MKDWLLKYLEVRKQTYINEPKVCISFYKEETQRKQEYEGRQLLELIQNAEDESPGKSGVVEIWLTENCLTIANNGAPFSKEGLESLMTPNVSAKLKDDQKIGAKGLGFRSLLNWSHSIDIISGDLSISFSRSSAIEFLKQLYKDHPEVQKVHQATLDDDYPIATLAAPSWKETESEDYSSYTTYVKIHFDDEETHEKIVNQLDNVEGVELLFLKNLTNIIINKEDTRTEFIKEGDSEVRITKKKQDEVVFQKGWTIFQDEGEIEPSLITDKSTPKNYELKIAVSDKLDDEPGKLYSYFKTKVEFSFPALVHGTFELSGDRNMIMKTKINDFLIEKLITLLIETSLAISERKVSWKPLRFLCFDQATARALSEFDFESSLLEQIKVNQLLPSIYGEYMSTDDDPVFHKEKLAEVIDYRKYGIFKNLCQHTDNFKIHSLLKSMNIKEYDSSVINESFNSISPELTLSERASLLLFCNEKIYFKGGVPNLLIDSSGEIIDEEVEVFSPPEISIQLPYYVRLVFLNQDLLNQIKQKRSVGTNRDAVAKISDFKITEYALQPVLRKTIEAEKEERERIREEEGDWLKPISELVRLLFSLWIDKAEITVPSQLKLPNRLKEFQSANDLFFGQDYEDGYLNEHLLPQSDNLFVIEHDTLGLQYEHASSFLKWCGVKTSPALIHGKQLVSSEYFYEIAKDLTFPLVSLNYSTTFKSMVALGNSWGKEVEEGTVEYFDEILESASAEAIICWIIRNSEIGNHLFIHREENKRLYFGATYKKSRDYIRADFPSFIGFVLAYTPWLIDRDGNKVRPIDCVLFNQTMGLENILTVPHINYTHEVFSKYSINKERIDATLHELGVQDDFSKFSPSFMYQLLLDLPELDPNGKYAGQVYGLVHSSMSEKKVDPVKREEFIENGKVLVRKNGAKTYVPVADAFYMGRTMYGKNITDTLPLFELERRQGNKKVKEIFGIDSLEKIEFRVISDPVYHPLNESLQRDFEEFKLYYYCTRLTKDTTQSELRSLKKLKVHFIKWVEVEFSFNGEDWQKLKLNYNEYASITKEGFTDAFIKIRSAGSSISDLKADVAFCDAIDSIISNKLDLLTDQRYLYSQSSKSRNQWIELNLPGGLSILQTVKKLFDQHSDLKDSFWQQILDTLKDEKQSNSKSASNYFKSVLGEDTYEKISGSINYHHISECSNFEILRDLFSRLNISIEEFNNGTAFSMDMRGCYQVQLESIHASYENRFRKDMFDSLADADSDAQSLFLSVLEIYHSAFDMDVPNSFDFDVVKGFNEWVKEQFGVALLTDLLKSDWVVSHLEQQLIQFQKEYPKVDIHNLLDAEKSLILFDHFSEALDSIQSHLDDSSESVSKPHEKKTSEELFEEIERDVLDGNVEIKDVNPHSDNTISGKRTSPNKEGKSKGKRVNVSDKRKLEIGEQGEIYVFHLLNKLESISDLKWLSKFAEKHKKTVKGNDSLGYDMSYFDELNKKRIFIEVKATTGVDIEFNLSSNEYNVGRSKKQDYHIIVVTDVENSKKRAAYRLKDMFLTEIDFLNNDKFKAIPDGYRISLSSDQEQESLIEIS